MSRDIEKLVLRAIKYNAKDFHVFVDYSGHIDKLSVYIHIGGWGKSGSYEIRRDTYTDKENFYSGAFTREMLLTLDRTHRIFRKNNISPNAVAKITDCFYSEDNLKPKEKEVG